jgi:hypothetical protein
MQPGDIDEPDMSFHGAALYHSPRRDALSIDQAGPGFGSSLQSA